MVVQLPEKCFDLVEIETKFLAGELRSATKASRIMQSFFKFLVGKGPGESYQLLRSVHDGKKTSTELNYVLTGKVNIIYLELITIYLCVCYLLLYALYINSILSFF